MEIILANDEKILKQWDYSTSGRRLDQHKTQKTLTVTNKRIVASEESTFTLEHEEIPLESVKGIYGYYRKNDSGWMKFKFVMSIIWSCTIIGALLGGISSAISLHQQLNSCVFYLKLSTNGLEGSSLNIGACPDTGLEKRKGITKMKVYVDKNLGKEIVSEIGAIIHNNGLPLEKDAEAE